MHTRTPPNWRPAALSIALAAILLLWLPRSPQLAPSAAATPHRVYVTFGFHVNLYHSFRGDSNDENGFGQDIRVIRHTLSELDRLNAAGIPVSVVWDFDFGLAGPFLTRQREAAMAALPYENEILFHWEHDVPPGATYRLRCRPLSGGASAYSPQPAARCLSMPAASGRILPPTGFTAPRSKP